MSAHIRSQEWSGAESLSGMVHQSSVLKQGYGPKVFDGRPVIGIPATWSELAPCNHTQHVMQADAGADFDFLQATRGHDVPPDSH
jgi:dihydroxyacid dehydratase/phosphogluconate dehydratase